jgi:hypothetical protein
MPSLSRWLRVLPGLLSIAGASAAGADGLQVSGNETLEARGLSVLLHHNAYHPYFGDQKLGGMELVLHGRRIATNGDLRLLPTPEQWDPLPKLVGREADPAGGRVTASCQYPAGGFDYRVELTAQGDTVRVAVHLAAPLPERLVGRAGFSLEFLPSAYFGKTYLLDGGFGLFPRHPGGPMRIDTDGSAQPQPLATGRRIVLAPEDPLTRVEIASEAGTLALFDGRNKAQNGWFVVRSLIPAGRTENAVVWRVRPNRVAGWTRPPVVAHSQVGYHPRQPKVAVLELDPLAQSPQTARVLRLAETGEFREAFRGAVKPWGRWYRYDYAHFDFTTVRAAGLYAIEYAGTTTEPFPIAEDVYRDAWRLSLDVHLPVQMDHVRVREAYRIWHGVSHLDDARQAPVGHTHFDGYTQGPATDSRFAPGEHIPGLDRGGWYDAGDFDLRTQTQAAVVSALVLAIERFGIDRDETTVDQQARSVEIRRPDGVPDAVQQVEHGVLALLGQFRAVGHTVNGIVEPTLQQYTHLGDGGSKTDNRVYSSDLGPHQIEGARSGLADDRWAFTNRSTPLDYLAASALAAASRVLRGHDQGLAEECLKTAVLVWEEEQGRPPALFESFNTTGGNLIDAEVRAGVELLITTRGAEPYRKRLAELLPEIRARFGILGAVATRALPWMDGSFRGSLAAAAREYKASLDAELAKNPFGVPISTGGWGGSGGVAAFALSTYLLHEAFPDVFGPEYTLRGVEYLLGRHPVSSVSYVSGVGARSHLVAYGSNRADYSFIPGGMIPGVLIVRPDFPELNEDWPFLWFENEYVVNAATGFILAANAADRLVR